MSREIEFQFLYKGLPFSSKNEGFNWHKKTYSLDQLIERPLSELSDVHDTCELVAKRQCTGIKDKNGIDIYEGDVVSSDYYSPDFEEKTVVEINVFSDGMGTELQLFKRDEDAFRYGTLEVIGNIHQNPELLESGK